MKSPNTKSGMELRKTNPELKEVAMRGNRPEMRRNNWKLGDKMAELDDELHKKILLTEPLLELPGERNLKTRGDDLLSSSTYHLYFLGCTRHYEKGITSP